MLPALKGINFESSRSIADKTIVDLKTYNNKIEKIWVCKFIDPPTGVVIKILFERIWINELGMTQKFVLNMYCIY